MNKKAGPLALGQVGISDSFLPIYYQIQSIIQKDIEEGCLKPGDIIPGERKLAERYQVSVGTVRQAVAALVSEGYLLRRQGKGTYVAGTTIRPDEVHYNRFVRDFTDPEAVIRMHLLGIRTVPAIGGVNEALNIKPEQKLFEVRRSVFVDEEPVVYAVSYLPKQMFPDFDGLPPSRFAEVSLYIIVEQKYNLPTMHNRELFSVAPADEETAGILRVPAGEPLQRIELLAYTYKQKPYEFRTSLCLTTKRKILREF